MSNDDNLPIEIERKFLVSSTTWRASATGSQQVRQGYLDSGTGITIRVRIANGDAYLTLKSGEQGAARLEFEYPIPIAHARTLLDSFCRKPLIEKTRFTVNWNGRAWSVDVFEGAQEGLVLAEIELAKIDEEVELPPWVGRDVTADPTYRNSNL